MLVLFAAILGACEDKLSGPPAQTRPLDRPLLSAAPVSGVGGHTEPSISVNPADPLRVATLWQVPTKVGWSADSGRTWQAGPRVPGMEAYQTAGDPIVFYDADGRVYALSIAFDRPGDFRALGRAAHKNGIFINRSHDGGATWRAVATAVTAQPELPGVPFEDKPAGAVDTSSDPGRRGNIHVAWTRFRMNDTGIFYARSTDGAASFSAPVEISDRPGAPFDTVGAAEGTAVAIAPNGTVYVVWSDSIGIWIDRSTNGGLSWGSDVLVARTRDMFFAVPGVFRANGFPNIDIDARTGRIYVQWVDNRTGRYVPWITTSTDEGRTWSSPHDVAGGGITATADRFFSWLSVDPVSGIVAVGYYRSEAIGEFAYYLAASNDDGASFQEWRWGLQSFRPQGSFIGDYTSVDIYDGVVHAAWTETAADVSTGRIGGQIWAGRGRFAH